MCMGRRQWALLEGGLSTFDHGFHPVARGRNKTAPQTRSGKDVGRIQVISREAKLPFIGAGTVPKSQKKGSREVEKDYWNDCLIRSVIIELRGESEVLYSRCPPAERVAASFFRMISVFGYTAMPDGHATLAKFGDHVTFMVICANAHMQGTPAWADPLVEGMVALQELPGQMAALQTRMMALEARMANWIIELPHDELTPFQNQEGADIPAIFPSTRHHLSILTLLEVNELLEYYGLPRTGGEIDRRRRLMRHLGVRNLGATYILP
ncbi:hypothetical protein R1flu_001042 [Riccia fluitans]|uniref:SAP domain-containing protein n=1 Tax=Riccia fluitans TaxID=41844 RepID=A0ABD1Y5B9_9MARC